MVFLQELTEEGIPFLFLFHVKEDTESLEQFQQEVARQLISEKGAPQGRTVITCGSHNFSCLCGQTLVVLWSLIVEQE